MSGDEPRRSGRATKGQHKGASDSPAPPSKAEIKGKKGKKTVDEPVEEEEEDDEEGTIRCICGNNEENDKRAFVACDNCKAWQHNVCMGMTDDDDDLPEQYFCEQCRPEDHSETLAALEKGEKIWETRNKLYQAYQAEKKKKRKSKGAVEETPTWLKKDVRDAEEEQPETKTTGGKRKRAAKEESEQPEEPVKPAKRQDKRRKAEAIAKAEAEEDPNTALVAIEKLPTERKKLVEAFGKSMVDAIPASSVSKGESAQSLADHHALRLEYALHINHSSKQAYGAQFRALNSNLKKNKALTEGLISGSLTANELSTMSSQDMASEELQKERAAMKAEADRQATIEQVHDGPRYRRTHKGDEIVENEAAASSSAPVSRPVRTVSEAEIAGSPVEKTEPKHEERRASNQTFDVQGIMAKTGFTAPGRPIQTAIRRQSTMQTPIDGQKVDADVDRLLADDDDETYTPQEHPTDIVWQGKMVQSVELTPTVNARWVAGRDISLTIPWKQLIPKQLVIDGRLQIDKAERYLCGLQWSSSSDVSVLALTPYDDATGFNTVFDYFHSRGRYAVVNKDRPPMVKDLYIIPLDVGAEKLPEHLEMLEHCTIKKPVEERTLLATFVVARAAETVPPLNQASTQLDGTNGHQAPPHIRAQSMAGPAASPIAGAGPFFNNGNQNGSSTQSPIVPANGNVLDQKGAMDVLGEYYGCPSAQKVLATAGATRDILLNMRNIFEKDVNARTNWEAFTKHLFPQQA